MVVRRISYLAGAISHSVLAGIGGGLYVQRVLGVEWFTPIHGAFVSSLAAAFILSWVANHTEEREDSLTGAIWAGGMAIGLLFIAKTPGYFDPMSYLFGDILLISRQDIITVAILDVFIIAIIATFYPKFVATCFDEEHAMLRGIKTEYYQMALLCMVAVSVVLLIRMVGIIMVIALLTIPAATAGLFAASLLQMIMGAIVISATSITLGLVTSYALDLPSGPVIILTTIVIYSLMMIAGRLWSASSR